MKKCTKCGQEKPLSFFGKDSSRADNLFPQCKKCRVKPRKERKTRSISLVLSNYALAENGCMNWLGVKNKDGYGMACYKGVVVRAHRLSYLHHVGLSDSDKLVLHRCDNRLCINPEHLYLGSNQDNTNDMKVRDRFSRRLGTKNVRSKITECIALKIFDDKRKNKEIAKDYALSASAVSAIKLGRNWGWLTSSRCDVDEKRI